MPPNISLLSFLQLKWYVFENDYHHTGKLKKLNYRKPYIVQLNLNLVKKKKKNCCVNVQKLRGILLSTLLRRKIMCIFILTKSFDKTASTCPAGFPTGQGYGGSRPSGSLWQPEKLEMSVCLRCINYVILYIWPWVDILRKNDSSTLWCICMVSNCLKRER